ncbi:hypothetical protein AVEN_140469-1 [Araneus ventricosus]|uniref:Uncharacterized protein n=1 Tax=Araneus ventricosus TaxID=182803 RepID=A0A4Y2JI92_ARAVE|nr:hypothetical protein AVEN_140469-1 [Araneus ventricosus]
MSGINLEEYLTVDDNLMVFEGVTEEGNLFHLRFLSEIADEVENDDDEDNTDTSQSLSTLIRGGASVSTGGTMGPYQGYAVPPPPVGENFCTLFMQWGIKLIDKDLSKI